MASGHDVNKPRTESAEPWSTRRRVDRDTFSAGFENFGDVNAEYDDDDRLDREMRTRSRLEDEYGGGAGDWDH